MTDPQLTAFGQLGLLQHLEWAEAGFEFTWLTMTPETRKRHLRLCAGKTIVSAVDESRP